MVNQPATVNGAGFGGQMTKAQEALHRKFNFIIEDIGKKFTPSDRDLLITILWDNKSDSIWGNAIKRVFENNGDVNLLIESLARQAIDDPLTMVNIVGRQATILLLRSYPR